MKRNGNIVYLRSKYVFGDQYKGINIINSFLEDVSQGERFQFGANWEKSLEIRDDE